jgi:hypothetical protein
MKGFTGISPGSVLRGSPLQAAEMSRGCLSQNMTGIDDLNEIQLPPQNPIGYNQEKSCVKDLLAGLFPKKGRGQMDVKRIVFGAVILLVVVAGVMYVSDRREEPVPEQAAEQPVLLEFMTPT